MPGSIESSNTGEAQPQQTGSKKPNTDRAKAAMTGFFDLLAEKIEVYTPKVKKAVNQAGEKTKGAYNSLADRGEEVQKKRQEYHQ